MFTKLAPENFKILFCHVEQRVMSALTVVDAATQVGTFAALRLAVTYFQTRGTQRLAFDKKCFSGGSYFHELWALCQFVFFLAKRTGDFHRFGSFN